jgi:hypothetical protein
VGRIRISAVAGPTRTAKARGDALPNDSEQVDEHPAAKEVVDLFLARCVKRRERPDGGNLVRGIVVDMQARVRRELGMHEVDESLERCPFAGNIVRPRALVAAVGRPPTPQVLDPAIRSAKGSPSRSKNTSPGLGDGNLA